MREGPMVLPTLDGTKTHTRRIAKVRGEIPPAWATFAKEGTSLNASGPKPSGRFYWSKAQEVGRFTRDSHGATDSPKGEAVTG
jgi:hypothetical protein